MPTKKKEVTGWKKTLESFKGTSELETKEQILAKVKAELDLLMPTLKKPCSCDFARFNRPTHYPWCDSL